MVDTVYCFFDLKTEKKEQMNWTLQALGVFLPFFGKIIAVGSAACSCCRWDYLIKRALL